MAGMGIGTGDSLVEALIENEPMRATIDNLDEVIAHAIARLRTESAHFGGDPVLDDLAARLAALESSAPDTPEALAPAFIPTRYRFGDAVLSLFSTFTQFGSAEDIALSEMRIEMMFPADEPTRMVLEALAAPT
jgi:hypothetical protein